MVQRRGLIAHGRIGSSIPHDLHDRLDIAAIRPKTGLECMPKIVTPKPYLDLPAVQGGLFDSFPESIGEARQWFSLVV